MKDYLKDLPLSLPTGCIVAPIEFDLKTQSTLRKWLDFSQIGRLQHWAGISINIIQDDQENPTLGNQRRVLETAGELAIALATILEQAPSTAEAELDLIFHKYVGGIEQKSQMAIELKMLACGLDASLQNLPKQDRRKSHTHFVSMIANVIQDVGIKPSVSENSPFYKICKTVFEASRIYQSPAAAIKGFIGK